MKIVILIVANDYPEHYLEMQNIWRLYMNSFQNIKSYFLKADENIKEDIILNEDESTFYIRQPETQTPGVLKKTIKTIEYVLKNMDFKYIFRTNLSCCLDLKKFYNFCHQDFNYAAQEGILNKIIFGSGAGVFFSRGVCEYLISIKDSIDYCKENEDVTIGSILYPIYGLLCVSRIDIFNFDSKSISDEEIKNSDTFHIRCKNNEDPSLTIYNMKKIYELFYQN